MNPDSTTSPANRPPTDPERQPDRGGQFFMWVLIIGAIVLAFVVFRLVAGNQKQARPQIPTPTIGVTNVRRGDMDVAVWAPATVQPVYTVALSSRVDGQIISVNYTEGQLVKSNDVLVQIDPAPYKAVLLSAQGTLARDVAALEGATNDLQRYLDAYKKNAIPKQQYDDQLALVHQDEGAVKLDQGTVSNAQVQVDYCSVRAPIDGRVGLRLVDPGNVVHAANSNAMVMIAQVAPITMVFNISEDYLPQIEEQLKSNAVMSVDAYDRAEEKKIAAGKFLTTDNQIDTSTGTIRIKAVFPNTDGALFPNQFVNARLVLQVLHEVNLVPNYTIQRNPQGPFVYVLTNMETTNAQGAPTNSTAVVMRSISTGTTDPLFTVVTEGLEPGEKIAADNYNKLNDKMAVKIRVPGEHGKPGAGGGAGPAAEGGVTNRHRGESAKKDGGA